METPTKIPVMILMVAALMAANLNQTESSLHRVGGGKYTWEPNLNYSDWANHENFYVGDWIYFGFNKTKYSVLQVNQTSYENCVEKDFITNITRGGRDVFQLTDAKRYFFISGRGYCSEGMKVAVNVRHEQTPPPAISPPAGFSGSIAISVSTAVLAFPLISALITII